MSRTNFNSERHRNWLAVVDATRIAQNGIAPFIQQEFIDWHKNLFNSSPLKTVKICICKPCFCRPGKVATCASCVCCQVKKKRSHCPECVNIKKELERSYRSTLKSKLCWQNSICTQWRTTPWEVAKVFLARLGPRAGKIKDANSTDISGLINLMEWCLFTTMPVSRAVLYDVRETRNMWAHEADMELSEDEMNEAFTAIESLLEDPVFKNDENAKKALKDLKELQDPNNRPQLIKRKEIDLMEEVTRVLRFTVEELQYKSTRLERRNDMLERATARHNNLVKKRKEEEEQQKRKEMIEKMYGRQTQWRRRGDMPERDPTLGEVAGVVVGAPVGAVVGAPTGTVIGGTTGAVVGGTLVVVAGPVGVVVGGAVGLVVGGAVGAAVGATVGAAAGFMEFVRNIDRRS